MIQKRQFFQTMTAQEFREFMRCPKQEPKENKYHAKKTEVDGITFDSKKEANDWRQLCMLEASGGISNLRRQVPFVLQEGYTNNQGKKIRPIVYMADFCYEKDGKKYVQDSKGGKATQTDVFKLKRKLFECRYPEYIFIVS